jgi:hypothetical protein
VIFKNWDIVETIPEEVRAHSRVSYGLDLGFSVDPAAAIECRLNGDDLYLDEVLYSAGLTNQQLAADLGPLAEPGARAHAVVSGRFVFGEFLEAWIKANNWLIPDLYCATLSLSGDNIDSLGNLLHGDYVQRLHLTVSDYWYSHERGRNGLVDYAYQELDLDPDGDRFQLSVTGSHAKVTLMAPAEGGHYVLHGSANLRSSASIEQFALENDPDLYAFHLAWIQALEAQYHTIRTTSTERVALKRHQWQTVQQAVPSSNAPTTPDPVPPTKRAPPPPRAERRPGGGR